METQKLKIKTNPLKKTMKNNKSLNIIFDLDETLVQTLDVDFSKNKNYIIENPTISNMSIINIANDRTTLLYIRPYFKKLIEFCFNHFNVSFWTAGTENYCNSVINIILTEQQKNKQKLLLQELKMKIEK